MSRPNSLYRLQLPLEYINPLFSHSPRRVGPTHRTTSSLAASERVGALFFEETGKNRFLSVPGEKHRPSGHSRPRPTNRLERPHAARTVSPARRLPPLRFPSRPGAAPVGQLQQFPSSSCQPTCLAKCSGGWQSAVSLRKTSRETAKKAENGVSLSNNSRETALYRLGQNTSHLGGFLRILILLLKRNFLYLQQHGYPLRR